ncbi:cystatin domain-containing protein, partial [Klebsiella pneumoniae]|nr:cystatin domain-containing protein [Klebsiella pneumoniae]
CASDSDSARTMASAPRRPLLLLAVLAMALAASSAAGASLRPGKRLLGGLEEADVNEEGVQRAVDFAVSEYNKASND